MRLELGKQLEDFRAEIARWVADHKVAGLEGADERLLFLGSSRLQGRAGEAYREWESALADARLICPQWPEEVGGRGLSGVEMAVFNDELHRAGMPRVTRGMGEWLVGPAIIVHGSEEQKRYFLPRIVSGEDRYCQGFSEPDHGSDLAGVETKGVVDGDELVISGQKVWTSGAHWANKMFILCRTNPDAPKHQGLSYVLVDMTRSDGSPNGIDVRPLRQMSGESAFCQELIEGARAPLFNVIGGLDNGWRVAMTTLGNERGGQATTQHLRYERELSALIDATRRAGKAGDPLVRQDLAWAYTRVQIMRYSGLRLLATLASRREPGPEASINKLFWSEYYRRFGEIAASIVGPEAMVRPGGEGYLTSRWQRALLSSRGVTIFSGTSEIQRNIIAERALGLPKEPGADQASGEAHTR
jgi:alkylation response protein AidB-like acyl-CoA dehydrogenase